MTTKERWLAALRFEAVDRLPFWPKLGGAYLKAHGRAGDTFEDVMAFHRWAGSDPEAWTCSPCREERTVTARHERTEGNETVIRYETPCGAMTERHVYDAASQSSHPVEFPVKTRDDVLAMTAFYDDVKVEFDAEAREKAAAFCAAMGEEACTATVIGESPLMVFVEFLAGVENAHYLLADYPEEVGSLFGAIHRVLARRAEITAEKTPTDTVYMMENTSTTLISPDQYRQHCKPMITEYVGIVRAAGKPAILHMCGHLKKLLPDLAETGATAFEAFTSPTLGDATLLDGRRACPDTCLIGGTNAMLWASDNAATIIDRLGHDLAELPHRRGIIPTSAGVFPPGCSPETLRHVIQWLHQQRH